MFIKDRGIIGTYGQNLLEIDLFISFKLTKRV